MKNEDLYWYANHAQDERDFIERNWNHVERLR